MKVLARWVARLYPAAWRERYAAELEALQENYPECWAGLKKRFNGKP